MSEYLHHQRVDHAAEADVQRIHQLVAAARPAHDPSSVIFVIDLQSTGVAGPFRPRSVVSARLGVTICSAARPLMYLLFAGWSLKYDLLQRQLFAKGSNI